MLRTLSFSRLLFALAALGPQLLATSTVVAQTSAAETAKVTQLFKSGKAAFGRGDMAEAERLFAEAFALRKSSDIAANLGQSELEQQKYRSAAEHFQWALTNLLPSASDAQRRAVETGLARSRTEVGVLRLDIKPDGAEVVVGDQAVGKAPVATSVYVEPGEVIVSVKHDGFVAMDKRVLVGKGTEQAVEVTLLPKESSEPSSTAPVIDSGLVRSDPATPVDTPSDAGKTKSLVPAFVFTGIAVAGAVTGIVFMVSANSKDDEANGIRDDLNRRGGCDDPSPALIDPCADLVSQRESVDTRRNLEIGSFVVGGVAAVAAGYFYWDALSHRGRSERAQRSRPLLAVTPNVNIGRAPAHEGGTLQSVRLGLSGTF